MDDGIFDPNISAAFSILVWVAFCIPLTLILAMGFAGKGRRGSMISGRNFTELQLRQIESEPYQYLQVEIVAGLCADLRFLEHWIDHVEASAKELASSNIELVRENEKLRRRDEQ